MPATTAVTADIVQALRDYGTGNGTHAEGNRARVLLETLPQAVLHDVLPQVWASENSRQRRRLRWFRVSVLPPVLLFAASGILLYLGRNEPDNQQHLRSWSQWLQIFAQISMLTTHLSMQLVAKTVPLQKGIIRLFHSRPHVQLVPLMIESLPLTFKTLEQGSKNFDQERRALLTTFLPLWCAQDVGDLTPKQRKILLGELKRIAFRGVGMRRNIGEATVPMSEADADFCVAVLNALRRNPAQSTGDALDRRTWRTLERLPDAVSVDDPNRRYLQEAAREVLTSPRR